VYFAAATDDGNSSGMNQNCKDACKPPWLHDPVSRQAVVSAAVGCKAYNVIFAANFTQHLA